MQRLQTANLTCPPVDYSADADTLPERVEQERLAALEHLDILDTPPEEAFDRITRLARKVLGVPVAIVSFIDGHRQWYKSCVGPFTHNEVPSGKSFCRYVVDNGEPMVIPDATRDSRFSGNPHVLANPGVRFYAGIPLSTTGRQHVGTICIVDFEPRDDFSPEQMDLLNDLAQLAHG